MASKKLVQTVLQRTFALPIRVVAVAPRAAFAPTPLQFQSHLRYLHITQRRLADATPTSSVAQSVVTPKAEPPPDQPTDPAKHAAFLGEADSNDGFETYKDTHGDPPPALDAENSAFHGEADSDDGFEARKLVDGEKLEAVDATNSAFLGEADSDDGFVAHRDAHPEDGDHKLSNPEEGGLHGQPGEQDQPTDKDK